MRTLIAIAILGCCFAPGHALAAKCTGSLTRPGFSLQDEKVELDKAANAINAWWIEGRGSLTFDEALQKRQADVDGVYSAFEEKRRSIYRAASCTFTSTKKCASTPGRKKKCPMTISPPSNMRFDVSTLKPVGNDFSTRPHSNGGSISYTVKKTGKGSNTAGFTAEMRFLDKVVDRFVSEDKAQVQQYLAPTFKLENIGATVRVTPSTSTSTCTSLASELNKLDELRAKGGLSPEQFEAAKSALIKHCS